MRKTVSLILSFIMLASALLSCAPAAPADARTSSSVYADEAWLRERVGELPGEVDIGFCDDLGVDMTAFEDEGYIIRREESETLICAKNEKGLDRAVRYYANHAPETGDFSYTYGEGYRVKSLTIAGRDICEYVIYMANDRDACHYTAANELAKYIKTACGAELEVVTEPGAHNIVLEQVHEDDPRFEVLGDEGFTVEVRENGDLYVVGGRYRGCLFGIYDFLEDVVGYRFIFDYDLTVKTACDAMRTFPLDPIYSSVSDPVEDFLFESDGIDVPAGFSYTETPDFDFRLPETGETLSGRIPAVEYDLKQKVNRRCAEWREPLNGYGVAFAPCHGINYYTAMYDEYVDLVAQGRQPCFTDESFTEFVREEYVKRVDGMIAMGEVPGKTFCQMDVAQLDNANYCTCKNCRKLISQDGSPIGPVVYFANNIAETSSEHYGDELYVSFLAYWFSCTPPAKTIPRENVQVVYCINNQDTGSFYAYMCGEHSLRGDECEAGKCLSNRAFASDLKRWDEISTRLLVWYYPGTWHYYPLWGETIYKLLDDYKFMKECHVRGMEIDHYYSTPNDGIIAYLTLKLMWDCDVTEEEFDGWIRDYFRVLYGEAWDEVYGILQLQHRNRLGCCWSFQAWANPALRVNLDWWKTDFDEIVGLYGEAVAEADGALIEHRVIFRSLTSYYTGLVATYDSEYVGGTQEQRERYLERWDYFAKYASEFDLMFDDPEVEIEKWDIETDHPGNVVRATELYGEWWKDDADQYYR